MYMRNPFRIISIIISHSVSHLIQGQKTNTPAALKMANDEVKCIALLYRTVLLNYRRFMRKLVLRDRELLSFSPTDIRKLIMKTQNKL